MTGTKGTIMAGTPEEKTPTPEELSIAQKVLQKSLHDANQTYTKAVKDARTIRDNARAGAYLKYAQATGQ